MSKKIGAVRIPSSEVKYAASAFSVASAFPMISGKLPFLIASFPAAVGILTFVSVLIFALRGWSGFRTASTDQPR
jgi:hypothetical protein